jgi:hypothetical protein
MGATLGATGTNNRLMANVIMPTVCAGAQPGIAPAGRRHSHLLSLLAADPVWPVSRSGP